MNSIVFFVFVFILNSGLGTAWSQDSLQVRIDSSRVTERSYQEDLASKYSGSEFDYKSSIEGEAENFIARALKWLINKMAEFFGVDIDPATYEVIEFLLYAILILGALYFIVRLLVGNNAAAFFSKKSKELAPLNIHEEHIERIDLDKFIRDALSQKQYRLAIRYMYLKALKDLSARNIISWHFDKTNLDYYSEIKNSELKAQFRKVSYLYDYVWYGEFEIDSGGFANAQADFERFTKKMEYAG